MTSASLPASYFDALYAANPDPWDFATSAYEAEKYRATLAALPKQRYASALEVGCSIGVLTRQLAERCDKLLAIDAAAAPLAAARLRCGDRASARFVRMTVPDEWPEGIFDLILLSEVVYYLAAADVARLGARIESSLAVGGDLLFVHWTGPTDYPLSGDEAVEIALRHIAGFASVRRQDRTPTFRLDLVARG